MAAEIYVRRVAAGDYRVTYPQRYGNGDPTVPLWFNHIIQNGPGSLDSGEWGVLHGYWCHFLDDTTDSTDWVVYDVGDWLDQGGSAVTAGGSWTQTGSTLGTNDAKTTGIDTSTDHWYTTTNGRYAYLDVTVPAGWTLGALLDVCIGSGSTVYNVPAASSKWQLYRGAAITAANLVPLNGLGLSRSSAFAAPDSSNPNKFRLRWWDGSGIFDVTPTSTLANCDLQIAGTPNNGLLAGETYRLVMTCQAAGGRATVSRVRLRRIRNAVPSATNLEYLPEFSLATGATAPGPYSLEYGANGVLALDDGTDFRGGPNHGNETQAAFSITADGTAITATLAAAADGTVLGPYSTVVMSTTGTLHNGTPATIADIVQTFTWAGRGMRGNVAFTWRNVGTAWTEIRNLYCPMLTGQIEQSTRPRHVNATASTQPNYNAFEPSRIQFFNFGVSKPVASRSTWGAQMKGITADRIVLRFDNIEGGNEAAESRMYVMEHRNGVDSTGDINPTSGSNTALKWIENAPGSGADGKFYNTIASGHTVTNNATANVSWLEYPAEAGYFEAHQGKHKGI